MFALEILVGVVLLSIFDGDELAPMCNLIYL